MSPRTPPVISVQAEVVANIRAQRIGGHSVADLHLPEAFLRRVADRVIRESFQEQHRLILAEQPGERGGTVPVNGARPPAMVERVMDADEVERRRALMEDRPERRSFRAALAMKEALGPGLEGSLEGARRAAADHIAGRLAADGLLATAARALDFLGAPITESLLVELDRLGLPTDMLAWFDPSGSPLGALRAIAGVRETVAAARRRDLGRLLFRPRATIPGFRADSESGQSPLRALRAQLTSGTYWSGPGDGGSVDLVRQLGAALPGVAIVASIERGHAPAFATTAADWSSRPALMSEELPVAQWAQDNAKAGRDGSGAPSLLAPRFASRGEVGAVLVPGETFLVEGLAGAGLRVARSPLLFQGGNLVVVEESSGVRTLLAGDAEVWRNTSLGLSREQVLEALRVEFGVDRCVDLASPSFHIDFEVSVRTVGGRTIAFVNDTLAAARIMLGCGALAMAEAGVLARDQAAAASAHLAAQRVREALMIVGPVLNGAAVAPGRYSAAFAQAFRRGDQDHGPSNLYRVLHAVDVLVALGLAPSQWPEDAHTRAYLETYGRQEADRKVLRRTFESLGWTVAPVPSLSDPSRGINALNGIHAAGVYVMPAYGGLFARLDDAAAGAFAGSLGPSVRVVRVGCAETQRRSGAVRCAVAPMGAAVKFGL